MVQKRKTASRKKILEAYVALLAEKKSEQISVTDICQRAQINRGTFYLHFLDKYDMIDQISHENVARFLSVLSGEGMGQREATDQALDFLLSDRELYRTLAQIQSIHLEDKITDLLWQILEGNTSFQDRYLPYLGLPEPYGSAALITAIAKIVTIWIANDFQESRQTLTTMILTLLEQGQQPAADFQ